MLSTSLEFRNKVARNSKTLFKATLRFADSTVAQLTGDDVMLGSVSISDAVSSDGSFDIGAAIINQFRVTLNNYDRRFDDFDFTGSTIVPYIGVELDSGNVEWLNKGLYRVDQPESYGNTIGLTALDNMSLFEVPYSGVPTLYPATLGQIVRAVCSKCGVTLKSSDFPNSSFVVEKRPDDSALTCLEVIGYAAQASGTYARIDTGGRLALEWYNTAAFEGEDWLDGGKFDESTPYASGDSADGGNFSNYGSGAAVEGGKFGESAYETIFAFASTSIVTDDVYVSGVRVTAQDEVEEDGTSGESGETSLCGTEGYVLVIEGNPLVQFGRASEVATQVGARVIGMRFRPFDVSAIGNPALEAGDPVLLIDRMQNQYRSYVTSLTYRVGNYEAIACNAETPGRNSAASSSAVTKALVEARSSLRREKTARQAATETLALLLASASGLYKSEEAQDDGSIIYYLHDKPTLEESKVVWKATADAFGVSNDGGVTYSYGVDSNGVAILNQLYAAGINADYVTAGAISVSNNGTEVFRADVDAGTFMVNTENFKVTPEGVITAKSGTIGGFTIGSTSLYNKTDKIESVAAGVYVGTDGIMTSDGSERIVVANGDVVGYQGAQKVGTISPTATVKELNANGKETGTVWRGLQLLGDALVISTPHLAVIDQNDATATAKHTKTETYSIGGMMSVSSTKDYLAFTPTALSLQFMSGFLISSKEESGDYVTVPTKSYVDDSLGGKADSKHTHAISDITSLQTTLNGKASSNHSHSGYASSSHTHSEYASSSHTHSYSSITGHPTFSLSGTTLTITT